MCVCILVVLCADGEPSPKRLKPMTPGDVSGEVLDYHELRRQELEIRRLELEERKAENQLAKQRLDEDRQERLALLEALLKRQ